jgi:CRP/FNR family transcriptional regulator, polysaccharide utilization system transcription regulator
MEKSFSTSEFSGVFVEQFHNSFDILKFKKNQFLYSEGSTPLGLFYLQDGEVLISKLASQGREHVFRVISTEGLLCCADLLLNKKYSSSSRAIRDSTVLFLPKGEFLELIKENEEMNSYVLMQLAMEVTFFQNEMSSLAYKPLRGRIADKLLSLGSNFKETSGKDICMSRNDLAGYAGTVKDTINRVLSEFQKEEMIYINEKQIHILDKHRLKRVSQMYD